MKQVYLSAEHIRKKYDGKEVLKDISVEVAAGETVALVGVNGCGKSTFLRILAGLTEPSGGKVIVREAAARVGFIPDHFEKNGMTIRRFMKHMLRFDGGAEPKKEWERLAERFAIEAMLDTPMKYLSKGTLQKAATIQALLGERRLLFLDEPLSGQDMLSQLIFAEELKSRKEKGTAVVMACHEPFLIEELADTVYQIQDGLLRDGTDYLYESRKAKAVLFVRNEKGAAHTAAVLKEFVTDGRTAVAGNGRIHKLEIDKDDSQRILGLLIEEGIRIMKYEEMGAL